MSGKPEKSEKLLTDHKKAAPNDTEQLSFIL